MNTGGAAMSSVGGGDGASGFRERLAELLRQFQEQSKGRRFPNLEEELELIRKAREPPGRPPESVRQILSDIRQQIRIGGPYALLIAGSLKIAELEIELGQALHDLHEAEFENDLLDLRVSILVLQAELKRRQTKRTQDMPPGDP